MSTVTNDAYDRLQKLLSASDEKRKPVIIDISLTKPEKAILYSAISSKMMRHASVPEYQAGLVADHLINILDEFISLKLKNAQIAASAPPDEESVSPTTSVKSPIFRRS